MQIAKTLNCSISDLLKPGYDNRFYELNFRKRCSLKGKNLEVIKQIISNKVNDYLEVLELNNEQPIELKKYVINDINELENVVTKFREDNSLGYNVPLTNLIDIMENIGICVIQIDNKNDIFKKFDGASEYIFGVPFVCVLDNHNYYRERFTLAHELGHLLLEINEDLDEEEICNEFAGLLLLPRKSMINEFGNYRFGISDRELKIVQQEYRVSIKAIIYRLFKYEIINSNTYKNLNIHFNKYLLEEELINKNESEKANRYEMLVLKLLSQKIITQSKARELLPGGIDE